MSAAKNTPEPTERELEEAIEKARARFESDAPDELRRYPKDFVSVGSEATAVLEGATGVKPLGEEEYRRAAEEADAAALAEWEEGRNRARMNRLLDKSELPAMYGGFYFSTFDPSAFVGASRAASAATEYAAHFDEHQKAGRGLVLSGPVGCGKTHLAVAVMRHVLKRFEVPALFVTVPGLLETERRSYDGEAPRGSIETAKDADLLILDDLGAERPSEWVHDKLFYLVNHRYAQGLPIVATTNLGLAETAERIGPRSMSRLAERCAWVSVEGEDYRLRALRGKG